LSLEINIKGDNYEYSKISIIEKSFESTKYGMAGVIDSIAMYESNAQMYATIFEYKSGNSASTTHLAQVIC
jgi:hypothetical protein